MIGQYSYEELVQMGHIVSTVTHLNDGLIVRHVGSTYNYYKVESDGSWTNYNCRTVPASNYRTVPASNYRY